MARVSRQRWHTALSLDERLAEARARLPHLVDRLISLFHLHEANRIITYSDVLAEQIPKSRAGNAYLLFRETMLKGELSLLCTLWDANGPNRISIPTIVTLIDDAAILATIKSENTCRGISYFSTADPELLEWEMQTSSDRAARGAGERHIALQSAISTVKNLAYSDLLVSIRTFRDAYLAHHLTEKARPDLVNRYGNERQLLEATIPIVNDVYLSVCGSSFDWADMQQQAQRYARALWLGCKFDVLE